MKPKPKAPSRIDLLQGTLEMLILKTLTGGAMHGYGIARKIQLLTDDVLRIEEGSLYPALHRMSKRGLIQARWGVSENNRRAKFYTLTAVGEQQLEVEASSWQRFSTAIANVMQTA